MENPTPNGGSGTYIFSTAQSSFSISDYENIDSVSFVLSDLSFAGANSTDSVSFELIDLNDNIPISNSKIISNGIAKSSYIATQNLIKYLPKDTFNIGIKAVFNYGINSIYFLKHADLVLVRK